MDDAPDSPMIDTAVDDFLSGASGGSTDGAATEADAAASDAAPRAKWRKRHPKTFWALVVMVIIAIPLGITWVKAMTKPGSESVMAKQVGWMRDMHLGFIVDRVEQNYYENNQPPDGGRPDAIAAPTSQPAPGTSKETPVTKAQIAHLTPPAPMPSPATDPIPNEGQWFPTGPLVDGLPAVYTTKVRPNAQKSSLLVFVAWIDPKLARIQQFPGTDLPGGEWATPNQIPADQCAQAIIAMNGGFRMDQARGGYYAEGREPHKLRDGAASMVFYPDGTVNIAQFGRDITREDLVNTVAVRQNLELLVDDGKPAPDIDTKDWGALLKNTYFVWRSAFGVTKDGALVYVGGPALQPRDLAERLIDAGAVRAMEGDINPEWVTANLITAQPDGSCKATKGLDGPEDKGGMRQPAERYLSTDTRDFVVAFVRRP